MTFDEVDCSVHRISCRTTGKAYKAYPQSLHLIASGHHKVLNNHREFMDL